MSSHIYRPDNITQEVAEKLVAEHGNIRFAARAIQGQCIGNHGNVASIAAIEKWIGKALKGDYQRHSEKTILDAAEADKLNQIKNALDEANIPVESIGKIDHVRVRSGYHEGLTKGPDGEPVVTHLRSKHVSVMLSPTWADGPKWPVIEPAKPVIVKNPSKPATRQGNGLRTVVVISDVQVGFLRDIEDASRLVPMHDPAAINVALQVVADIQPDQLVYVGDFLDLPEMSRYLQLEEFWRTTQPAIDEGYKILAQFEAAAGPDRLPTQFISGNHDRRLREYTLKNARAAFNLRPAQETPESWPDLTVPRLLRFGDLGIAYVGEYPGGEFWITPRLVVRHDPKAKDAYAASVIGGHTHHIRRETFTRRTEQGPVHHTLYEIGCLASLENYSDNRSLMATRVPSNRAFTKDWAHGFAVVYVDEDGTFTVDQVEINNGRAIYGGRRYSAT